MKLKTFEGFEDTFLAELTDFSETNLAYLLDNSKYKIKVMQELQMSKDSGPVYKIIFTIDKSIRSNIGTTIVWIDIKDYILQFYHILKRNYKLIQAPTWMSRNSKDNDNYIGILVNTKNNKDSNWNSFSADQLEWIDIGHLTSIIFFIKE